MTDLSPERHINPYIDFGFKFLDEAEIACFIPGRALGIRGKHKYFPRQQEHSKIIKSLNLK